MGWGIIEVEAGGTPAYFILDTGSPTVIDLSLAQRRGWPTGLCVGDSASLAGEVCQLLHTPELIVGGYRIEGLLGKAVDFQTTELGSLSDAQGILGSDALSQFVVIIDYPHASWRLLEPQLFAPPPDATPVALDLALLSHLPFIPVTVNGRSKRFLLDTGARSTIVVRGSDDDDDLIPATLKSHVTHGGLRIGFGGAADTTPGYADFGIAGVTYRQVPVTVATNGDGIFSDRGFEGILGVPFLEHFRVTIDYPGHRVFFEQLIPFSNAPVQSLGLVPSLSGGRLVVRGVETNGPAYKAGVQVGDEVASVNGVPVTAASQAVVSAALRWPLVANSTLKLEIVHAGQHRTVVIRPSVLAP